MRIHVGCVQNGTRKRTEEMPFVFQYSMERCRSKTSPMQTMFPQMDEQTRKPSHVSQMQIETMGQRRYEMHLRRLRIYNESQQTSREMFELRFRKSVLGSYGLYMQEMRFCREDRYSTQRPVSDMRDQIIH